MKIQASALIALFSSIGICSRTSAFTQPPELRRGGVLLHELKYSNVGRSKHFVLLKNASSLTRRYASEKEEDSGGPLSKGIDSVSWLPSVIGDTEPSNISSVRNGAEILPLFPLGGIVYTPNSEHILNIFEPRYRKMYSDILMNGTKRFVVSMSHPEEQGRFAETGVLFELEDLKEVSEQTKDQIKYVCNHRVTGRVKLHRIINPQDWESRETYLTVEGTIYDDTGKDEEENDGKSNIVVSAAETKLSAGESALKQSFASLVEIQHELEEDVRFTRASVDALAVYDGPGENGLWQTIRLWQAYADQRLVARQNELQKNFQDKLQEFLTKEKGLEQDQLPSTVGFQDLSPELQNEVKALQKRMGIELQPLILESTLTMQKILEAKAHEDRCDLLRYFIDAERKRLSARKTLREIFSSYETSVTSDDIPAEEQIYDKLPRPPDTSKDDTSLFDDPDAFQ